jgi:hypothetical protein
VGIAINDIGQTDYGHIFMKSRTKYTLSLSHLEVVAFATAISADLPPTRMGLLSTLLITCCIKHDIIIKNKSY